MECNMQFAEKMRDCRVGKMSKEDKQAIRIMVGSKSAEAHRCNCSPALQKI